jgi:hypothetical protein
MKSTSLSLLFFLCSMCNLVAGVPYVVNPGGGGTNLTLLNPMSSGGNVLTTNSTLNGAKLGTGTVNSNKLDAATWMAATNNPNAQTNISYAGVTNAPWLATNGNASGLTALNGTQVTSGTVPSAQLPIAGTTIGTRGVAYVDNTTVLVDANGRLSANLAGGVATNVPVLAAGTNISIVVNGLTNTISASFSDTLWTNKAGYLQPLDLSTRIQLKNGLLVGTNTVDYYGVPTAGLSLSSFQNTALGDVNYSGIEFGVGDPNAGGEMSAFGFSGAKSNPGLNLTHIAAGSGDTRGFFLNPMITDNANFIFQSTERTGTNLVFQVKNGPTNLFTVAADGTVFPSPWLLPNGDGSQLTGIIATNTTTATWTNNGSVDSNMVAHIYGNPRTWEIRRPTDGFCTYPSMTYNEAQVIQAASNMWVRGYVAAGMDLLELSDGWGNTNRTVGGALMYNTANFPSGMPWVVEHCRTNYGVKIGFYMQGAHQVTNSVSVWGSIPTTDFQHLDMDVNTMVGEWGASHIRSDWFGFDQWDDVRAFLERLTYQADYASKTNINNQRPVSVQWFTDLPAYWDIGLQSPVPPFMADYANVMRVGSDHSSRELVLSGLEFMKHYFHLIGPGHYIFTDTEMDSGTISGLTTGEIRRNIGLGALMHSPLQFTWNGLATAVPTYTYKEEWFTNSRLRDIRWDAAANPPRIAYTNLLSGTNAGECWITPLQNGDYAVALWNRANTGGSLSNRITIEQAGLNSFDPQNGTYWTRSATSWTNANGYVLLNDAAGTDRGIYWQITNTTYGMSYYYLYPALTNANGAQWIATNGFVNGGSMKVWYDQGRTMSFGTTNIAALGTGGWSYRDIWTGWYGTATNSLTWSVPTNDLALFRVSAPALWPVAAAGSGTGDVTLAMLQGATNTSTLVDQGLLATDSGLDGTHIAPSTVNTNVFDSGSWYWLTHLPYDPSGTASAATNGLGAAAFKALSYWDVAGTALAATNGLGAAAFKALNYWDISGTAQAATNGYPWTNVPVASATLAATATAATRATNFVGQLSPTNWNNGTGASASTYAKGDGTWGTPGGSGDVVASGNNNLSGSNNFAGVTIFSNNVTVYGDFTVVSTNLTTTVSNLTVNGTITSTNLTAQIAASTNGLGAAAFKALSYWDVAGTAQSATNGFPWTNVPVANATLAATATTANSLATTATLTRPQITNALTGTITNNTTGSAGSGWPTTWAASAITSGTFPPARLAAGGAQSKVPSIADAGATTFEWVDMTPAFSLSAAHTFTGTNVFTVPIVGSASGLTNASGNLFGFITDLTVSSGATNFVANPALGVYQRILATNNVTFAHFTNGPGALSVKIRPNGADRTLMFPTNWVPLYTNGFALSGAFWTATLTNAVGTTGPRIAKASMVADGSDQTNVVWGCIISP